MPEPRNAAAEPAYRARWIPAGPVIFLALLLMPRPEGMTAEGQATLAMAGWMAAWWLTVALPLAVTALLPLVLIPVLGIGSPGAAAAPYANSVIFLFMGGFFIATAMQRWHLHRRIALAVVARTGTSPRRLVAGFMLACALLSMWMSNTAATLMMMPIGIAVLSLLEVPGASDSTHDAGALGVALMLGIAYAGSIGGVATLIGTPPNAVLAGLADELLSVDVSFARWMTIGLPVSGVMLIACWALLCLVIFPLPGRPIAGAATVIDAEQAKLGAWQPAERVIAWVFGLAAFAWIFRAPKQVGDLTIPGIQTLLPEVGDSTIAIGAALLLFLWPARDRGGERTRVLDWSHAAKIPWDILVLFGGGLSLAAAFASTGLTTWLGGELAVLDGLPNLLIIAAVATTFVFVTEITSNTATATLGLPVMAALGPSVGVEPLALMTAAAMGSSMAFMLPVATPPNAIVFGTGYIEPAEMSRAGFWLNWLGIIVITTAVAIAFG
ncbi:MAG TPA: DASS family sodium-coupled anion symporter [Gemmatimonadota bacterium]|nr:DASS family sodium-coupled anion symporter [Gemmatimonadota bacterium]